MTVQAYCLLKLDGTMTKARIGKLVDLLRKMNTKSTKVLSAHILNGPFDVIIHMESPSDGLQIGKFVNEVIRELEGVDGTATCIVVD